MAALQADEAAESSHVLTGSAFDPAAIAALDTPGYDLVITNPPYVRYQSQNGNGAGVGDVRRGLSAIVDARMIGGERTLWQTLVDGYSGLRSEEHTSELQSLMRISYYVFGLQQKHTNINSQQQPHH